jgi:hypothetical protein
MLRAQNPNRHPLGHTREGPGSKIAVYANDQKVAAIWRSLPSTVDVEASAFEMLA